MLFICVQGREGSGGHLGGAPRAIHQPSIYGWPSTLAEAGSQCSVVLYPGSWLWMWLELEASGRGQNSVM